MHTEVGQMKDKSGGRPGLYRVKTVAAAAGITPTLLRAWERRYSLFEPERQPSLHRLYTEDDMAVVRTVRKLLDSGLSIGEVAALGREALLGRVQRPLEAVSEPLALEPLSQELESVLSELAPNDLTVRRSTRFAGEELGVSLRELHPADMATTYSLYQVLKGIYEIWVYMEQQLVRQILVGRLRQIVSDGLIRRVAVLGAATGSSEALVVAALEDTRGGALSLLMEYLEEDELERLSAPELRILLTLARDHAKMMRNAFYDLDAAVREGDESAKAHSLRPVLLKLAAFRSRQGGFRVGSNFQGFVSCRCLETSALDRVTYNFMRRALAPGSGGGGLWVSRVNSKLCRWAFECTADTFRLPTRDELPVRAVALAMGVTPDEALSYAYLGSTRRAGRLWAWFHWPLYEPSAEVPQCRCEPLEV